jgi:hypothetical protein
LDFVIGLPSSQGFDIILTVVDRFTKMVVLIQTPTECDASDMQDSFLIMDFLCFVSRLIWSVTGTLDLHLIIGNNCVRGYRYTAACHQPSIPSLMVTHIL